MTGMHATYARPPRFGGREWLRRFYRANPGARIVGRIRGTFAVRFPGMRWTAVIVGGSAEHPTLMQALPADLREVRR